MGVPEQLRRLDEDLATGRVDAETYRRRRDEILAARLAPPPPPAPRPGASADGDLDDSELDAAERELGFAPEFDTPYPGPARPDRHDAPGGPPRDAPRAPAPPSPGRTGSTPAGAAHGPGAGPGAPGRPASPPAREPTPPTRAPAPPTHESAPPPAAPAEDDPGGEAATAVDADPAADRAGDPEVAHPRAVPVPPPSADAPPLPGTPSDALRPPPPPVEDDDAAETDERPRPVDPFPPPFRWSAREGAAAEASPDTTQVVHGGGASADRTQVVPAGRPPEETQVVPARAVPGRPTHGAPPSWPTGPARPPAPPERTQFVPGAVPARAAGGGVARPEETAPPWASAAARSEGLQGRELFARGPGPRAGAILGTAAVLLLVLLVLVASFVLA
ncbi:hypothetical protein [Actinomycetospora cinnamomea]|uniref:Uncharacterized protein n=1 Tax=Actinomycetospora cinnamomea TaxID=663609 RepID=A0A2U1FBT1_9PSEU|nr:hypothetical protein [Actinomycetospora cinnamomea]PVZ09642.1 hypothetical protein C8D89_106307 [Actinomycetospora cinnamomea]